MTKKEINEKEQRIKLAAKKLFLQKWFNGTTSRDIAKEAGVNFSLLNYHFWSKKELFDSIILETFKEFSHHLFLLINNETTSFSEKMIQFCNDFFVFLLENEQFFAFIQKEVVNNPQTIQQKIREEIEKTKNKVNLSKSILIKQYQEETHKTIDDFRNFFTNIMSLIVYPILSKSFLWIMIWLDKKALQNFLMERKNLIIKMIPLLLKE